MPVKEFHVLSTINVLRTTSFKGKECYEPLYLNDLAPATPKDLYNFIQSLKENGCQLDTAIF